MTVEMVGAAVNEVSRLNDAASPSVANAASRLNDTESPSARNEVSSQLNDVAPASVGLQKEPEECSIRPNVSPPSVYKCFVMLDNVDRPAKVDILKPPSSGEAIRTSAFYRLGKASTKQQQRRGKRKDILTPEKTKVTKMGPDDSLQIKSTKEDPNKEGRGSVMEVMQGSKSRKVGRPIEPTDDSKLARRREVKRQSYARRKYALTAGVRGGPRNLEGSEKDLAARERMRKYYERRKLGLKPGGAAKV